MRRNLTYWLLLLLSAGLLACDTMEDYQTDKFTLSASPATADGYPVEIYRGNFIRSDGGSFPVPSGNFLTDGWRGSGTSASLGEAEQPAPDSLEILWYSYPEDKFYEGHFLLPQQRIHALLKQGYWNTVEKQHQTYYELSVCVLPTGGVVVWLTGQNKVLIGRFQARETKFDFKQFNGGATRAEIVEDERARLSPEVQREVASGTLSTKKWDEYLKTYPWQLAFSQPVRLLDYGISYLSAEGTDYPLTPDPEPYAQVLLQPSRKPVPNDLALDVLTEHGALYKVWVDSLDETETMGAFRTLHQLRPQAPITLLVDLSRDWQKASLRLRNEAQDIPLTKNRIRLIAPD